MKNDATAHGLGKMMLSAPAGDHWALHLQGEWFHRAGPNCATWPSVLAGIPIGLQARRVLSAKPVWVLFVRGDVRRRLQLGARVPHRADRVRRWVRAADVGDEVIFAHPCSFSIHVENG